MYMNLFIYITSFFCVCSLTESHPWGLGCSQGREERRDESFQDKTRGRAPGHGINFHQTISKRSSECWLLIGHKKSLYYCPFTRKLCVQGKLSFSTFLTIKEGITDDSSKRFGCYQQDQSNLHREKSVS